MFGTAAHLDNETGFELLGNERPIKRREPMRGQLTIYRTLIAQKTEKSKSTMPQK